MDDDWLDELDDLGIGTPPEVIDAAIARMTPLATDADEWTLYHWARLHLTRMIQAAMMPGRWSAPGDADQAVGAGEAALGMLRQDADGEPGPEVAVLDIVAEALTVRDAGSDLDRAIELVGEAARRFRPGSQEWAHAVNSLAHRHVARYVKHHRAEDFDAAEQALRTLFGVWGDRPSLWQRHGSLYEERFRHAGDLRDHRRALRILRDGWDEDPSQPLLALSFADAVVNSPAEPGADELDAAAEILSTADVRELPPPMRTQFHYLTMVVQFRRQQTEATVRAAGRLIEQPGTEPDMRAEARWIRASARLDHASRAGDRTIDVDPIIADLRAALPFLNPGARRVADAQLARTLAERVRRTGERADAEAAEAFAAAALPRLPRGSAERAEVLYHLAFQLLRRLDTDRGIAMLRDVVTDPAAAPKVHAAAAAQLATSIAWRGHHSDGAAGQLDEAITLARDALRRTSRDDTNRVALAAAVANALMLRFETRGDLADLRWGLDLLGDARYEAPDDPNRYELLLALAQAQIMWAEITGTALPADTPHLLIETLRLIRPDDPARVQTLRSLGATYVLLAQRSNDREHWERAAGYAREVVAGSLAGEPSSAMMRMSAGSTLVLAGRALDRYDLVREGADLIAETSRQPTGELLRGRHLAQYGMGLVALRQHAPQPGDLGRAVAALREAFDIAAAQPGQRGAAEIGMALAAALVIDGDPAAAAETGRRALRARAWQVLLQSGTHDAMTTARRSSPDALAIARAALSAGDPAGAWLALETGRGLVLHAATVAATVPELLRAAGRAELADQWGADPSAGGGADWRTGTPVMPSDARFRALRVLAREARLFDPPSVDRVGDALRDMGADALVYLFPGEPGFALLVEPGGAIGTVDLPGLTGDWAVPAAVQAAVAARGEPAPGVRMRDLGAAPDDPGVGTTLAEVCRAAWDVAIRPLLDHWQQNHSGEPHLVLVPDGALATVPWHAAHGDGRWAIDEAAFSYIASGRLLVDVAGRPMPERTDVGLVIGDPDTGDTAPALPNAGAEASTIFRKHYAAGRFCGRSGDPAVIAAGPGLPGDVLGWLTAAEPAAVLHLACHGVVRADGPASSYLLLAGGAQVSAEELLRAAAGRSAGLVSLAACTTHRAGRSYDEAVTLSTGFLVAGATTAIGSLWPVPDRETARLMVAFHDNLAGAGLPPHVALREAQRSVRDPADDTTLTHWAGFVHLGR
ncbi:CHAT domain-containing protein [Paractinoplanes brasiliensis]|uniref:CHAT domain-containing protein n=1 Tax=Paractinoplanes brasiliensis TaxID=52695 RepID=A0A4R6JAT5_9ACTN|nr:CHAT domain-containing protein [Actinoplanes brasiliensis]TDO32820.1 CHAT domain-containing protein [Actinoplanes brasiliensis]GID31635.1 hypothetical protein Abr02nite_66180 [Actinoplanes brasiliensis]